MRWIQTKNVREDLKFFRTVILRDDEKQKPNDLFVKKRREGRERERFVCSRRRRRRRVKIL